MNIVSQIITQMKSACLISNNIAYILQGVLTKSVIGNRVCSSELFYVMHKKNLSLGAIFLKS